MSFKKFHKPRQGPQCRGIRIYQSRLIRIGTNVCADYNLSIGDIDSADFFFDRETSRVAIYPRNDSGGVYLTTYTDKRSNALVFRAKSFVDLYRILCPQSIPPEDIAIETVLGEEMIVFPVELKEKSQ